MAYLTWCADSPMNWLSTSSASPRFPDVPRHTEKAARIGLWVPWADTDSIGWVRYILDERKVPYTYLRDEDIRAGSWRNQIDVLLYGHVDLELAEQIQGLPKAWGPMPFKKAPQSPSFGTPAESDDITGGIGSVGLEQIQEFVETAACWLRWAVVPCCRSKGGSCAAYGDRPVAFPAARKEAECLRRLPHRTPPLELRERMYGLPLTARILPSPTAIRTRTWVFRQNYPLYDIPRKWLRMAYCTTCLDGPLDRSPIVMEWGDREGAPFVVSGQAWGEERLIGRPALLDMPAGKGHVVVFNFNPLHRDMNRGDQRMLWNALLNWQAIVSDQIKAPESLNPAPEPDE